MKELLLYVAKQLVDHPESVVVEQDDPSMQKTPMECAEMSINYLKNL